METRANNILVGSVTLALLLAVAVFTIWLARFGDGSKKEYDIFFKQSVAGLAKGSAVAFSGVPVGTIEKIELWRNDPEFVRVRISIDEEVPILIGTTATISGVGFTGVSEIQLDSGLKDAPDITAKGPAGVPVIPTKPGALGELLNNAPQLVERLSTLTERLNTLLSDENQDSFSQILANVRKITANVDTVTGEMKGQGPQLNRALREAELAIRSIGEAAEGIERFTNSGTAMIDEEGKPLIADLRGTVAELKTSVVSANRSLEAAEKAIGHTGAAADTINQQTLPEIQSLVRDLRNLSNSLGKITERIDDQGVGGVVGSPKLPDYKP